MLSRLLLAAALAAGLSGAAQAQTTRSTLTATGWTDICTAPCRVKALSSNALLVVDTAVPVSLDAPATVLTPDNGFLVNDAAGTHVYGRAQSAQMAGVVSAMPAGSAGAAALSGSTEQDQAETRTLNATSTASQQTYTLNGQGTFSFTFTGLAASGATVSFFQSNDWNGTTGTFTPVSEVNTGNGIASLTRSIDGQSAIGVEGTKAIRVQVTTVGAGTITLATNISVRSRYAADRSPVMIGPTTAAIGITPVVARATPAFVAKSGASNLYGLSLTQGATAGFFAILDAATAPAANAAIAPQECIAVPVNSVFRTRQDIPDRFANGVTIVSTSSCSTYTAVTPLVIEALVQ